MFLTKDEKKIENDYLQQGYIIKPSANRESLDNIKKTFLFLIKNYLHENKISFDENDDLFNNIHKYINIEKLNDFRLKIIQDINNIEDFRKNYFNIARQNIESLIGSEIAMQLRINLSIQFPQDDSSLLPIHADTWSGDSPFEIVVWTPLVDCYKTKAMFLLQPKYQDLVKKLLNNKEIKSGEDLFLSLESKLKWMDIKYGNILIFNQGLPHGNRINLENETRWSLNCRFKSIFSPYGDKKLGEFFEPVTLKPASLAGMKYEFPN